MDRQIWNVLLIEHNPEDVQVFERALASEPPLPGRLHVQRGIEQAIQNIEERAIPAPSLVLFNTRAPELTNEKVVAGLGHLRRVTGAPVLLFCATADKGQIENAYRSYAAAYAAIPEDRQRFESMVREALDYWLIRVLLPHPEESRPASSDGGESPQPS